MAINESIPLFLHNSESVGNGNFYVCLEETGLMNIEPDRPHFFLPNFFLHIYRMVRLFPSIRIALLYFAYKQSKGINFYFPLD